MVKRKDFDRVLGFDEKLAVAFNDIDFCLKIRSEKLLIVYNPFVEAYHYESKSRGEDTENENKQRRTEKAFRKARRGVMAGNTLNSKQSRL